MRPVDELRSAVVGNRTTGAEGQGTQGDGDQRHDGPGALLEVAQDHDEPAEPLDHRGDVCGAELLPEVNEGSLPRSELPASRDNVRSERNAEFERKFRRRPLATTIAATSAAAGGKVAPELGRAAFVGMHELVDGFLARQR